MPSLAGGQKCPTNKARGGHVSQPGPHDVPAASHGPATSSPGPGSSRHCPAAAIGLEGTGSPAPRGTRSRRLLESRHSESGLSCDPVWSSGDQHPDHPAPSCVTQESPATEPHSPRSRTDHSGGQQASPWGGPLPRQPQHLRERRSRRESADPGPHLPLPQRCPGRRRSGGQQQRQGGWPAVCRPGTRGKRVPQGVGKRQQGGREAPAGGTPQGVHPSRVPDVPALLRALLDTSLYEVAGTSLSGSPRRRTLVYASDPGDKRTKGPGASPETPGRTRAPVLRPHVHTLPC